MKLLFNLIICIALGVPMAHALEKITHYDSQITVMPDGELDIVETITVIAEHQQIKRGIYRDFPTIYKNKNGGRHQVGFNLIDILRDGVPEPYKQKETKSGVRIYIGNAMLFVPRGEHTYQLHYTTDRQLQFFEDRNELYFNAIPQKFLFPIEKASVEVTLPYNAEILKYKAYTGPRGSRQQNADIQTKASNIISFVAREPLKAKEGMTIVLAMAKGAVAPPSKGQIRRWYWLDHQQTIATMTIFAVFLAILLMLWFWLGRDPKTGVIIPRFKPPAGLSPAICHYLTQRAASFTTFAVALLSLATKGYIYIGGSKDAFTVVKSDKDLSKNKPLSIAEKLIFDRLFKLSIRVRIGGHYDSNVAETFEKFKESLESNFQQENLIHNTAYWVLAIVAFVAIFIVSASSYFGDEALFVTLFFGAAGIIVTAIFCGIALQSYKSQRTKKAAVYFAIWPLSVVATVWLATYFGPGFDLTSPAILYVFSVIVTALGVSLFCAFIGAPTVAGRKLLDEIEGFRWYLSVAEGQDIKGLTLPQKTPQLYERFLPYALALGVQNKWAEQFADVLEGTELESALSINSPYSRALQMQDLANNLNNGFSQALDTTSTAPPSSTSGGSSSSGFSSGGSSGGGGGGGGGGGW